MGIIESLQVYFSPPTFHNGAEVSIMTNDRSYLTVLGKESALTHTTIRDNGINFTIEMPEIDRLYFRMTHGLYLSAEKEDYISQVTEAGEKETFYHVPVGGKAKDKFYIKTYNNKFVSIKNDFKVELVDIREVTQCCHFDLSNKYVKDNTSLF